MLISLLAKTQRLLIFTRPRTTAVQSSLEQPGIANLRVEPIEPLPPDPDYILDKMMSTADFETPLSSVDSVDSIPASTKLKT